MIKGSNTNDKSIAKEWKELEEKSEKDRLELTKEFEALFGMSPDRLKADWGFNLPTLVRDGKLDEVKKIMEARLRDLSWNPLNLDTKGYNYFTCQAFNDLADCEDIETIKYFLSKCQLQNKQRESVTHFSIDENTLFDTIQSASWSEAYNTVVMLYKHFENDLSQNVRLKILKFMEEEHKKKSNSLSKINAFIETLKKDKQPECFTPFFNACIENNPSEESIEIKKNAVVYMPGYYPGKGSSSNM